MYEQEGEKEGRLPLEFVVGPSAFVRAESISEDDFADIIKDSTLQLASTRLRDLSENEAVAKISPALNLRSVASDRAAALFGRSVADHPVCVYLKKKRDGLQVDIKTSSAALSKSLMSELKSLLRV